MKTNALLVLAAVVLLAVGCGPRQQSATTPPPAPEAKETAPAVAPGDLSVNLGGAGETVDLGLDGLLKDPDAVVATIGPATVTNQMLYDKMKPMEAGIREQHIPAEQAPEVVAYMRRRALSEILPVLMFDALAAADNVVATSAEVDAEAASMESMLRQQNQYDQFMQSRGWTPEDLRKAARLQVLAKQLMQKHVVVSDASVEQFYAQNQDEIKEQEKVHARHILFDASDKATAEKVLEMVKAGSDFAELARQYSKDPGSASNGGDLGFNAKGRMVPEFDSTLFALADGQTAPDLVKTQFGYHIIRREETQAGRAISLEEVRPKIKDFLERQEFREWMRTQEEKVPTTFTKPEDDPAWQPPRPASGEEQGGAPPPPGIE